VFIPTTYGGRIYGLPTGRQMAPLYYNKQIFADNGVEVPRTWDEFVAAIQTFKAANIVPIVMATRDPWVIAQFFLDITGGVGGMELFQAIQAGEATWDDPRYIKSGELLQELVAAGAFPENFSGLAYEEGTPLFVSGGAAMYPMGTWMTAAILEGMDAENVGVFLPPAYDAANSKTHLSQVSRVWAVSETCKNKDVAMAFLKMFSEDDIQEKMVTELGLLPATNYKADASKIEPVTAAIIDLAERIDPLTPFDVLFGTNIGVEFNNVALAIATGKPPADQFAQLQAYAQSQRE
jgi:raffinose/stachyose/melibiose transport system substrate-binding protein